MGKSINLFLMDGTASGRIKCTLANWIGLAYKIPRLELQKFKNHVHLKQSGIYFLFGTSEKTNQNMVYIGQAGARKNGEGILCRLYEHKRNPDKDYWTEAIIFTTSDNSFGPTEITYLEHRFASLATDAKRYLVKNGNAPSLGNITEEKESELEEFVDYAKLMMGTLGHKLFDPLNQVKQFDSIQSKDSMELVLYMKRNSRKSGQLIEASCKQTNEGFVVMRGSRIETIDSDSIPSAIKDARSVANIDTFGILQEDILFRSPSYAAAFVIGGYANGLTEWKDATNKTLKQLEAKTF